MAWTVRHLFTRSGWRQFCTEARAERNISFENSIFKRQSLHLTFIKSYTCLFSEVWNFIPEKLFDKNEKCDRSVLKQNVCLCQEELKAKMLDFGFTVEMRTTH
uniref:Uncharacterized protein n=1 Tax=Hemiselmis tepida TaxID=464990 RepID=A0A6T6RRL5_9CRYP|mmetsp:Transcript_12940/g.33263  ORF Transcript_12940/g.33263 Transcript_12940/m.33263 type:complete len:103 (+) Transcript_12940:331-639(+)